jgi:hypothetical protein
MMISDREKGRGEEKGDREKGESGPEEEERGTVTEGQSGGQRMDGWKHRAKIIS